MITKCKYLAYRELRDWYFTRDHRLFGVVYNDDSGFWPDGEIHEVASVRSISELQDRFIVKTPSASYNLMKVQEKLTKDRVQVNQDMIRSINYK